MLFTHTHTKCHSGANQQFTHLLLLQTVRCSERTLQEQLCMDTPVCLITGYHATEEVLFLNSKRRKLFNPLPCSKRTQKEKHHHELKKT